MSDIEVVRGGMLTTVQDRGRSGLQRHGVTVGGAMDPVALQIANLLVGNPADAAALECTVVGPQLRISTECVIAVTGHAPTVSVDGVAVADWRPFIAQPGSVLTIGGGAGCRAYVAIGGGIDVPLVLGSRSTDLISAIGGVDGRALVDGDALTTGTPAETSRACLHRLRRSPGMRWSAGRTLRPAYAREPTLRVLPGPEIAIFGRMERERFLDASWRATPQSNRMGYRLQGSPIKTATPFEMISSPVVLGTVQVPPSGQPVVLMADRQTIGGYPRLAHVISADIPLLAQVRPGVAIRFREVTLAEAQSLIAAREHDMRMFATALRLHLE